MVMFDFTKFTYTSGCMDTAVSSLCFICTLFTPSSCTFFSILCHTFHKTGSMQYFRKKGPHHRLIILALIYRSVFLLSPFIIVHFCYSNNAYYKQTICAKAGSDFFQISGNRQSTVG